MNHAMPEEWVERELETRRTPYEQYQSRLRTPQVVPEMCTSRKTLLLNSGPVEYLTGIRKRLLARLGK